MSQWGCGDGPHADPAAARRTRHAARRVGNCLRHATAGRRTPTGTPTSATTPIAESICLYGNGGKLCRLNLAHTRLTVCSTTARAQSAIRSCITTPGRSSSPIARAARRIYTFTKSTLDGRNLRQLTDGPVRRHRALLSARRRHRVRFQPCQAVGQLLDDAGGRRCTAATPTAATSSCISANIEQDNTPWPLPDGRILYHALGIRGSHAGRLPPPLDDRIPTAPAQMVYFGNLHPGTVMIDAKPIPGIDAGRGHLFAGARPPRARRPITVVDPRARAGRSLGRPAISRQGRLSRSLGLLGRSVPGRRAEPHRAAGRQQAGEETFTAPAGRSGGGLQCHEPRPLVAAAARDVDSRPHRSRRADRHADSDGCLSGPQHGRRQAAARSRNSWSWSRCPSRSTSPAAWTR